MQRHWDRVNKVLWKCLTLWFALWQRKLILFQYEQIKANKHKHAKEGLTRWSATIGSTMFANDVMLITLCNVCYWNKMVSCTWRPKPPRKDCLILGRSEKTEKYTDSASLQGAVVLKPFPKRDPLLHLHIRFSLMVIQWTCPYVYNWGENLRPVIILGAAFGPKVQLLSGGAATVVFILALVTWNCR